MRRLGVDPGSRRIGLALCDEGGVLAYPHRTVERTSLGQAVDAIVTEAETAAVGEVVFGLPLRLDGTVGGAARRARDLARRVAARLAVPVVLWDERLSTSAAERALSDAGVHGRRRRGVVDQAAAVVVLQSYLDSKVGSVCRDEADEAGDGEGVREPKG